MKISSKDLVIKVAELHSKYHSEFLTAKKRIKPRDFKSALDFIFGMSFFQGRKDSLSEYFYILAIQYIYSKNISSIKPILSYNKLKEKKEKIIKKYKKCLNELENIGLKKEADRIMVIDTIGVANHVNNKHNLNIVDYIVNEIKRGNLIYISNFLDNVYSIGPKISGLILRDIVHIYNLETYVSRLDEYSLLQPMDTWVHQVSLKIGIIKNEEMDKAEAIEIIKFCLDNEINPLHYNEGAWYLGSQSFKMVLNSLVRK